MNSTTRPNVRFRELQANQEGMASPAAIDGLAVSLTLLAVGLTVGLVVLLEHLSDFWAGLVLGGLSGMVLMIGLLAVGACLGGARLSDPPHAGVCDRGAHR